MSYFRRFFFLLVLLSLVMIWVSGLGFFSKAAVVFCGSFLTAVLFKKFALAPWKEFKSSLLRIKNREYEARLDDVKGGDVSECARIFNELAEDLAKYRKLSENREKRMTALINSVNNGLLLFDPDSSLIFANANIGEFFPYFRKEAPTASLDIPFLTQFVEEAKSEWDRKKKDFKEGEKGKGRVFSVTFAPLEEKNWALIIDDITAEARMEQVKSDLVANVSHELRTPISAVSSICDVLEDSSVEPEKSREFISRLKKQTERMSTLVEDLLSLSRLESGEITVKKDPVNLGILVDEIISSLEPARKTFGIEVVQAIDGGLTISTDQRLLEHAVKNILDNAIRYNKPDGKVFVRAFDNGESVRLEIEDTGEGIPREFAERIFERFFRIDAHRSREKGGTGLGLSIAKHSVKLLNGDVRLESSLGKGSLFIITLPK